jgi:hypothetical protein
MSKLLHLINRLKAQANPDMLTASQYQAFIQLNKQWHFPDKINLCGPQGSGKTFLGWVIARYYSANFYASPQTFEQDLPLYTPDIIIDNAPTEEKQTRRMLSEMQLRQVRRALLITNRPITLGFQVISLSLPTEADIVKVYANLNLLQFQTLQPVNDNNFWNIIYSAL